MRIDRLRFSLAAAGLLATLGVALAATPRSFDLPGHGTIRLVVPDEWRDELDARAKSVPPTVIFSPRSGAEFRVMLTPLWRVDPASRPTDEARMHDAVAAAAHDAATQSVESSLPIEELHGETAHALYFSATDRAPRPGEYKYLTQGIVQAGPLVLGFTVLTNDGQDAVRQAALEMMRTAGAR